VNGRLAKKTNASGSTVSLGYGPLGLLKALSFSSNEIYGYSYDLEGRRTQATVANGPTITHKFDYGYDAVGNLISYIEKGGSDNILGKITKPAAGEMYSKTDQLIGFDLTLGTTATIPYAFFYSSNKLVEKVSSAGKDTLFKYDEGSKLKIQTNANGVQDRLDYNEGNQLTGTSSVNSSGTKTLSSQYAYDSDGRLVKITGIGPGSPSADTGQN